MKTYRIKVAIPSIKNAWAATIEERIIEAENFNYLLMKSMSIDEHKRGARIVRIEERVPTTRGFGWKMIKRFSD